MRLNLIKIVAFLSALTLVLTLSFGCKTVATTTTAAAAETTAASTTTVATTAAETTSGEPVKLVFWWWGEQEAPGLEKFVNESIKMYEEKNPNITIEAVLQPTETLVESFRAAAAAKQGPDIQYFWGGSYTLEDAWKGSISPISDNISAEDLKHLSTSNEQLYDGKTWGAVWYMIPLEVIYNKEMFKKAGLDPENPPKTWDEFMTACQKLKDSGVSPFIIGNQRGNFGSWFETLIGAQAFDSTKDYMEPAIGKAKYTDPKYADWWEKFAELRDKGFLNKDFNSLQVFQTYDAFVAGKGAITVGVDSVTVSLVNQMGEDKIGVMVFPVWANGKLAGKMDNSSQALAITSWSQHKKEAADFIMFLHSPERLNAMYAQSGALPADDRFDVNTLKFQHQKWAYQMILNNDIVMHGQNYRPGQIDTEGYFTAGQKLFDGATPQQAAQIVQDACDKWRSANPDMVKNYEIWYQSYAGE